MKNRLFILSLLALFGLASCGTTSYYSSVYDDSIYSRPQMRLTVVRNDDGGTTYSAGRAGRYSVDVYALDDGETYEARLHRFDDEPVESYTVYVDYYGWDNPWYNPWWGPAYYYSWYSPWRHSYAWYNTWWYDSWYGYGWRDPYWYSGWAWYDPWYHCSWYNCYWGPHYGPYYYSWNYGWRGYNHHHRHYSHSDHRREQGCNQHQDTGE